MTAVKCDVSISSLSNYTTYIEKLKEKCENIAFALIHFEFGRENGRCHKCYGTKNYWLPAGLCSFYYIDCCYSLPRLCLPEKKNKINKYWVRLKFLAV